MKVHTAQSSTVRDHPQYATQLQQQQHYSNPWLDFTATTALRKYQHIGDGREQANTEQHKKQHQQQHESTASSIMNRWYENSLEKHDY